MKKLIVMWVAVMALGSCGNNNPNTSTPTGKDSIQYSTVQDIHGKEYKTVKIGSQTWLAENLQTTFKNTPNHNTSVEYVIYENNYDNLEKYGLLYCLTGESIQNNIQDINSLIPGFEIPNKYDWERLFKYVGSANTGGKLMSKSYWQYPKIDITDEYGFGALPGGFRSQGKNFGKLNILGMYACVTVSASSVKYNYVKFANDNAEVLFYDGQPNEAYSIRLIKK